MDRRAIVDLIRRFYSAFQVDESDAVLQCLVFPVTFWGDGRLFHHADSDAYLRWRSEYLTAVKATTGLVRGEILDLDVERLGKTAALVKMRSSRLDGNGALISIVRTGFIVYRTEDGWRVSGTIASI
jgi:hypothetical protein